MPTYNRRRFVPLALRYFFRQDYPHKELVVVDDGTDSIEDLLPSDPRVRYLRMPARAVVGAKRNLACEAATGAVVTHWDDDDWAAPTRLTMQVETLLRFGAALCGARGLIYFQPDVLRAWRFEYPDDGRHWLIGSSLCYLRELWVQRPFLEIDVGEDSAFVLATPPEQVARVADTSFQVGLLHGQNVSRKRPRPPHWRPYPLGNLRTLLGTDWHDYAGGPVRAAFRPKGAAAWWAWLRRYFEA
jgi:glycosyltransferase involved in cell wall biosynthesis